MNRNHVIVITGLAFMLGAGSALAQDDEELDATITVMGNAQAATPEIFMTGILLPDQLTDGTASVDNESANSDLGRGIATGALANRQMGLNTAANAMIEEVTTDVAEAAQDKAENSSRAEDVRPEAPGERPVPPGG